MTSSHWNFHKHLHLGQQKKIVWLSNECLFSKIGSVGRFLFFVFFCFFFFLPLKNKEKQRNEWLPFLRSLLRFIELCKMGLHGKITHVIILFYEKYIQINMSCVFSAFGWKKKKKKRGWSGRAVFRGSVGRGQPNNFFFLA